jgi:hypothetical protein
VVVTGANCGGGGSSGVGFPVLDAGSADWWWCFDGEHWCAG